MREGMRHVVAPGTSCRAQIRDGTAVTAQHPVQLLAELLDQTQAQINVLSPALGLLDRVGGRTDEAVANFSMNKAREAAWRVAQDLAPLSRSEQLAYIAALDGKITALAHLIRHPGLKIGIAGRVIRLFEQKRVATILDTLA